MPLPSTPRIVGLDLGREIDLARTMGGFTVTVERVCADSNQVVIGYSISGPPRREFANFHPFDPADSVAPTLTDARGRQLPHAPTSWRAGIEDGIGGYVEVFDATSIMDVPQELSLRLEIPALTVIERVEDGANAARPAASSCEPGICRFTVPGPFTFDLTIPFEPGRMADLHQVRVVNGKTVTLERVATTPTGTRVDLSGAGPHAEVTLVVDGVTYVLQPPGAIPSSASPQRSWAYVTSESLVDKRGEWTLVVKPGPPVAGTPAASEEMGSLVFGFSLP